MKALPFHLLVLFCCLAQLQCLGQRRLLAVVDSVSGLPIPIPLLFVPGGGLCLVGNSTGEIFGKVPEQQDTAQLACMGYRPKSLPLGKLDGHTFKLCSVSNPAAGVVSSKRNAAFDSLLHQLIDTLSQQFASSKDFNLFSNTYHAPSGSNSRVYFRYRTMGPDMPSGTIHAYHIATHGKGPNWYLGSHGLIGFSNAAFDKRRLSPLIREGLYTAQKSDNELVLQLKTPAYHHSFYFDSTNKPTRIDVSCPFSIKINNQFEIIYLNMHYLFKDYKIKKAISIKKFKVLENGEVLHQYEVATPSADTPTVGSITYSATQTQELMVLERKLKRKGVRMLGFEELKQIATLPVE